MVKITVTLSSAWVLKHRIDNELPVEVLKEAISKQLGEALCVEESGITAIIYGVKGDKYPLDELREKIIKIYLDTYPDGDESSVSVMIVSEPGKSEDDGENLSAVSATQKCMDKISELVGGEEFKRLAKELVEVAPQIIESKTYDIFKYQAYIFSINDGYGLSTYLSLLSELIESLGIKDLTSIGTIIEERLGPPKGESLEPFDGVRSILGMGKRGSVKILCIDISEWMNNTDSRAFKNFLIDVERHLDEFIIIFRVPFVDKEVLDKVGFSLNDLMFVRPVSFAPFNKSEIQKCASLELEKYGFKMSSAAWDYFHERIAEEKSDGKFYGLNTIKKVVRELLYKKQLSNARLGKSDLCISKKDAQGICFNSQDASLSGYEMLDNMVGGSAFKQKINEIISQIEIAKSTPGVQMPCIHMRFVGNPGTGKTTVARIIGKIFKEKGILRIGNFYEYTGRDFCGRYIGETAPKTASMCRDAYGSILFIDEAYSLYRGEGNERDYGREALDTLIAEMENHRSDLVVIMAGYTDDMEKLMQGNAGLASRMPYVIEFPNFTREELYNIFVSMLNRQFKYDADILPVAKDYFMNLPEEVISSKEFSNARFVRNLFERTFAKASMRCQLAKISSVTLTRDDFERSTSDKEFTFIMQKKNKIGFLN